MAEPAAKQPEAKEGGEPAGGEPTRAPPKPKTPAKYQPSDFLKAVLGRPVRLHKSMSPHSLSQVIVKLNSGVSYRGILACLDGYMNIAMEQTEEYVDGQLKAKYGDCFIRGNNVHYISTVYAKRR